jgi:formylglycine-generating enzyme required for sulfatase activity
VYDDVPDPCLVVKVNDTLSINMMCVEGGTFMMGRNDAGAPANEKPAHQVTLSDYLISQTEVTQGLWQAVMGTTDYKDILNNNHVDTYQIGAEYPAYGIKLSEAQAFINRLNQLTNLNFRLPTEAEWEYAARGGQNSKGYIYSGSNNLDEIAWYALNSNNEMHRVAQLKPNELGIYDMSGNGWEICADGYANYSAEEQTNPLVECTGNMVIRGGSSYYAWSTDVCHVTYRMGRAPEQTHNRNVIRLVLHDIVPVQPEPDYVDLGLSVKWARCNIGATTETDAGLYFQWGDTHGYTAEQVGVDKIFNWNHYIFGPDDPFTKYNAEDGLTALELEDDAAYANMGEDWRVPTKEQFEELKQLPNTWVTNYKGTDASGFLFTAENGNTLFFPAAGMASDNMIYAISFYGLYWSANCDGSTESWYAGINFGFGFGEQKTHINKNPRFSGYPIRGVRK